MAYNTFGGFFQQSNVTCRLRCSCSLKSSSQHRRKSSGSTWADWSLADSFQEGDQANHLHIHCRHSSESSDLGSCATPGSSSPLRSVPSAQGCCWSSPLLSPEVTVTLSREDLAPQVSWLLLAWRIGGSQCMQGQPQEFPSEWAHWSGGWTELGPGQSVWQHPWPPADSGHTRELPQPRFPSEWWLAQGGTVGWGSTPCKWPSSMVTSRRYSLCRSNHWHLQKFL